MVLLSSDAKQGRGTTGRPPRVEPIIALVTESVYAVMTETDTLGFVQQVGTVFVALSGDVLSHAVEIGQSLSWDQAVRMVRFQ